jgi:hypothetical protein
VSATEHDEQVEEHNRAELFKDAYEHLRAAEASLNRAWVAIEDLEQQLKGAP